MICTLISISQHHMSDQIYHLNFSFYMYKFIYMYVLCNFSTKNRIIYIENNSEFSSLNFNKVLMYTFGSQRLFTCKH